MKSEGRYPEDWNYRQAAMLDYYDERCARCRQRIGSGDDVLQFHVHHVIPISRRGGHELSNLVALCEFCHALIHPDNDKLANWRKAPLFPASGADHRVAVERIPQNDFERAVYDLRSQSEDWTTTGEVNEYARSRATTPVPARIAVTKDNPTRKEFDRLPESTDFDLFCHKCGKPTPSGDNRCDSCGGVRADISPTVKVGVAALLLVLCLLVAALVF